MLQFGVSQSVGKERVKRVLATDGSTDPIDGPCVFFLRPNFRKGITTSNISDVRHCLFVCLFVCYLFVYL